MGFQRIDHVHLEYNTKYKIYDRYKGIYKGRRWTEHAYPSYGWGCHLEFENVHNLDNHLVSLSMIFSTDVPFYEFFSKKEAIQSCMEYRAVNLILRKVIGDETFSWII
jgi:hypothetical protein